MRGARCLQGGAFRREGAKAEETYIRLLFAYNRSEWSGCQEGIGGYTVKENFRPPSLTRAWRHDGLEGPFRARYHFRSGEITRRACMRVRNNHPHTRAFDARCATLRRRGGRAYEDG